jgi:hypothetical protein
VIITIRAFVRDVLLSGISVISIRTFVHGSGPMTVVALVDVGFASYI